MTALAVPFIDDVLPPATVSLQASASNVNQSTTFIEPSLASSTNGQSIAVASPDVVLTPDTNIASVATIWTKEEADTTPAILLASSVSIGPTNNQSTFGTAIARAQYYLRLDYTGDGPGTDPVPYKYDASGAVGFERAAYGVSPLADSRIDTLQATAAITAWIPGFGGSEDGGLVSVSLNNLGFTNPRTLGESESFEIIDGTVYLTPGVQYEINMTAAVQLHATGGELSLGDGPVYSPINTSIYAFATVDPFFQIDPSVLDFASYSLSVSPNIVPVGSPGDPPPGGSSVPDTGSTLMMLGMALTAIVGIRSKLSPKLS
jgi:protein with PEP-CTERM/exosortase system signal